MLELDYEKRYYHQLTIDAWAKSYACIVLRLTAEKALQHPYLAEFADPSDEPISGMHKSIN